jgi:hypothetical protein
LISKIVDLLVVPIREEIAEKARGIRVEGDIKVDGNLGSSLSQRFFYYSIIQDGQVRERKY